MSDYLAHGVEFAITQTDLVLLEKGPRRIPMNHISRIEVQGNQRSEEEAQPKSQISIGSIVFGALALVLLFSGWVITALLSGAVSAFLFFHKPSNRSIFRAYAWTNGLGGDSDSFHVANYEIAQLKRAMSHFPEVTLQLGSETVTFSQETSGGTENTLDLQDGAEESIESKLHTLLEEQMARYNQALQQFESGNGDLRVAGAREFSALAEQGAKIPELYFRLAIMNQALDAAENWAAILKNLDKFCEVASIAEDGLHTRSMALDISSDLATEVADALWEDGRREASFTYLHSLRYWLEQGNTLTAQSDVKRRLAFERARIIADLDAKEGNEDRRNYLLEFCSEFQIDPEIVVEG